MLDQIIAIALGMLIPALAARSEHQDGVALLHRVRGYETVETIGQRYGMPEAALRAANGLSDHVEPKRGHSLEVVATKLPPPLIHHTEWVGERETWASIAEDWGVEVALLRHWNPRLAKRKRGLPKGAKVSLWLPSGVHRYPLPSDASGFRDFDVRDDALSIGSPSRGKLRDGVQLPKSDLYTRRFGWQSFGSTLTVEQLQRGIDAFRRESGFEGEIKIGAMSQKHGRRLRPHQSHQSGRDVDIRMPAASFAEGSTLQQDEIDWPATFALVDALIRTDAVQVIFLERKLNRKLRRAGRRLGASEERVRTVMGKLRHAQGHTAHIHVRFVCSPANLECDPST